MQWIVSWYALLLLVFNCNLARGYLIRVEARNETRACATNDHQHAVAFVQNVEKFDPHSYGNVETFSKVDIFNLDGNANEIMHEFDCNLIKSGGCEHWRKENLRMKPNNHEKYPPITDFRWHDIPVIFLNAGRNFWMENFLRNTALHAHFSILTNSNFYFLIDPDYLQMSTFRRRYKEPTPDDPNGRFFWHDRQDVIKTKEINLKNSGKKWELVSLRFSEDDPLGNEVKINSGEISFPIAAKSATRKFVTSNVLKNSFFPFIHFRGVSLVKMHLYSVLVPENAERLNASMERHIDFQKETAFCVDVVYLMRSPLKKSEWAFSLTLTTEQDQYLHFTEAQPSKGVDTWHVVRFESLRRFSGKGTLKLSVKQRDLEIGGIKFCPGGDSVIVPKLRGMQQCHSLSTNVVPNPVEEEIFTGIVGRKDKICKRLNGWNCSEMKVCGSKSCECFYGFTGENCKKPCEGKNCSSKYIRQCLNDKFNLENGLCLKACANPMLKYPFCTSQIRKVKPFVWKASPNSISLNMSRSLASVSDFDHIRVRCREKHGKWWWNKIYKESDGKYFTLEGLKDKTEYVITFTVYEHDWNMHWQNLVPGEEVTATTCTPINGSILQLDGATFTVSNLDKKFCQPKQIDVTEISPGNKLPISSKIQILDYQEYQKNLNSCKTGTYYFVLVSDIYQNRVEASLECSDENQLTTKHPPRDYPLKPLCLSINESFVQISFEDQVTVVFSSNASDREKICKPSSLRVIESRKILFSATVDGFDSKTVIGNCSIGKKYQIILADKNEHEMKFSYLCLKPEQFKFQRMTPVVHQIWARKIELDMSQILNDDQLIEVQYKEEHTAKWKTNSYQKSMGGRLILNFLKPKTLYAIRFVQKTFNHTSIKSKESEARTKPCLPIDEKTLEMKFEAPFTAVARVKADLDEKENLCRLAKIQVISDKLLLLDTRVYDSELRWDLSPCRSGSQYLFRLEDEQGNVLQTNGTCAEGVEVVANKPSDITDSQQILEMVFTGTVLLLMLSIICFYGTCICCEKRRRARQLAEEERQEIQRRYMSQIYVF